MIKNPNMDDLLADCARLRPELTRAEITNILENFMMW